MSGYLYCFNTISDPTVYKAGYTTNQLAVRFRGYLGPSKPRTVVFGREVDDSLTGERLMLALMRQCCSLCQVTTYGPEWFQRIEGVSVETLHQHLLVIADIVQMAVGKSTRVLPSYPCKRAPSLATEEELTSEVTLPGMETYYTALNAFVESAHPDQLLSVEALVGAFEASEACPILCQFALFNAEKRLRVARARFPHLLPA